MLEDLDLRWMMGLQVGFYRHAGLVSVMVEGGGGVGVRFLVHRMVFYLPLFEKVKGSFCVNKGSN